MFRTALLAVALVFPPHYGLVNDTANMLGDATQLENKLRDYQARTGNAIVIASIPTLGDYDIKEYANRLFHEWGIGDKEKDNGVLILWAVKERKVRIEVGYGLEPILTDGRSGQILREIILPEFKAGRYLNGLNAGVDAITTQLEFKPAEQPMEPQETTEDAGGGLGVGSILAGAAGLIALFFGFVAYKTRKNRREEETRLAALRRVVPSTPYVPYIPPTPRTKPTKAAYVPPREDDTPRRSSSYESPSYSSPSSSWSDSGSSSSSGYDSSSSSSFGGGDSGGGGADGSY